jgi:hypothetical protein
LLDREHAVIAADSFGGATFYSIIAWGALVQRIKKEIAFASALVQLHKPSPAIMAKHHLRRLKRLKRVLLLRRSLELLSFAAQQRPHPGFVPDS